MLTVDIYKKRKKEDKIAFLELEDRIDKGCWRTGSENGYEGNEKLYINDF